MIYFAYMYVSIVCQSLRLSYLSIKTSRFRVPRQFRGVWSIRSTLLKRCTLKVLLPLMGHCSFACKMQYFTTIVYDNFWYDSVRMKRPCTIDTKYCASQAELPCPSGEVTSFTYTDLSFSNVVFSHLQIQTWTTYEWNIINFAVKNTSKQTSTYKTSTVWRLACSSSTLFSFVPGCLVCHTQLTTKDRKFYKVKNIQDISTKKHSLCQGRCRFKKNALSNIHAFPDPFACIIKWRIQKLLCDRDWRLLNLTVQDFIYRESFACFSPFYAPGSNGRGHIVLSCLSVCPSDFNFNFRYNFYTIRYGDFVFGIRTPFMMPF